jgi:hypothetical protein
LPIIAEIRGTIIKIGYVDEDNIPQNWKFDCNFFVPAITITDDGLLYAGYSVEELKRIAETVS